MITIKDLTYKINKKNILNNINLTIPSNTITALIGPNGAGKTTLIEIIAKIRGENNSSIISKQKTIYIHPELLVFDFLTAEEYINMIRNLNNISEIEANIIINDFKNLNIKKISNTQLKDLSLGEKQKLLLLTGFLSNPDFLLFDEPFNGLDINSYKETLILFEKYKKKFSIFFSTHELENLSNICDAIIFIKDGEIKQNIQKENGEFNHDFEIAQLFQI